MNTSLTNDKDEPYTANLTVFTEVLDLIDNQTIITDISYRILYVSPSLNKSLSLKRETLKGDKIDMLSIIPPAEHESFVSGVEKLKEKIKEVNLEVTLDSKESAAIKALCTAKWIDIDGYDKCIMFCFVNNDFFKDRVDELERDRHFFQAMMNNIPDTIYFKDVNSRFTAINKEKCKQMGIKNPEEALGKTDFDYFDKDFAEAAFNDEQKIIETGVPLISKIEKRKDADGQCRWVLVTKVPVKDSENRITGIVGISRDITHIKEVEEKLEKITDELRSMNTTKDKLFSIIAHDLRNPFNSLMGISQIILSEYHELNEEEKLGFIGNIEQSARNAFDLIENLLYWSRSQTNAIQFNPSVFPVAQIINRNINVVTSDSTNKNISVTSETDESITAFADKDMIDIVIRNVLSNAVKFTNQGGVIFIDSKGSGDWVEIRVQDNGVGMSEEKIKNLFHFEKIDSSYGTALEKGTGLGLLVCKEFMDINNGSLAVESKVNEGTTIILKIPAKEKK